MEFPEPTISILDPDPVCRDSLSKLARAMELNTRAYATAAEFLMNNHEGPGCLFLELRLPDMLGIEVLEQLIKQGKTLPVIMLSAYGDVASAVACMQRGAVDFLEKPSSPPQLRSIIRRTIEAHTQHLRVRQEHNSVKLLWKGLTTEERIVAQRVAIGETNQQIADGLNLSLRTVQFRRTSVMSKLRVDNKVELIAQLSKAIQPVEPLLAPAAAWQRDQFKPVQ